MKGRESHPLHKKPTSCPNFSSSHRLSSLTLCHLRTKGASKIWGVTVWVLWHKWCFVLTRSDIRLESIILVLDVGNCQFCYLWWESWCCCKINSDKQLERWLISTPCSRSKCPSSRCLPLDNESHLQILYLSLLPGCWIRKQAES